MWEPEQSVQVVNSTVTVSQLEIVDGILRQDEDPAIQMVNSQIDFN